MKKTILCLLILCIILCLPVSFNLAQDLSAVKSPLEIIQDSIDEIIKILNSEEYKNDILRPEMRKKIFSIVDRRFSWKEIAKRSLGRLWREQAEQDQKEYMALFAKLLRITYIDKVEGYSGEKVSYSKQQVKGKYSEVQTEVIDSTDKKIPINYRMIKAGSDWLVYDIVIEGVSLVKNYRSQFEEILQKFSFEEFLKKIEEKIKEKEAKKTTGSNN